MRGSSPQVPEHPTVRTAAGVGLVAAIAALSLGIPSITDLWKPWWDSAIYLDLARSLIADGEYSYMGHPHTKYPPGYPLLLALITLVGGEDHAVYRGLGVLSAAVASFLTPFVFRRRVARGWLLPLGLLVAVSPSFLFFEAYLLSDLPFAALSLGALVALGNHPGRDARGARAFVAGVLLLASCLVRLAGISLVAALLVTSALRSGESGASRKSAVGRAVLISLPALAFVGFWLVRGMTISSGGPEGTRESISYGREFVLRDAERGDSGTAGISGLFGRMAGNVPYYAGLAGSVLSGTSAPSAETLRRILALLIPIGLALGLLGRMGRPGLHEAYLLATLGLYLVWPAREDVRFLVPIVPLILLFGFSGPLLLVSWFAERTWPRRPDLARLGAGFLLVLVPGGFALADDLNLIRDERDAVYMSPGVRELRDLAFYLRDHTPEEARIVSDSAPWVHFWSRRPTFSYPWVDDPEAIYRGLKALDADYVVVTSLRRPHQQSLVQAYLNHPQSFEVERTFGKSVLLKVVGW